MPRSKKIAWIIISIVILVTGYFGSLIPGIVIDNEIKNYLPHDMESYNFMTESDSIYGSEILMDIALQTKGESILTPEAINKIKNLTDEVSQLEFVDKVQSLTNVDYITSEDGTMIAKSLVSDDFTGSAEQLKQLKENIVDWEDMYDRVIISKDFKGSQIIININMDITPKQMDKLYEEIDDIVQKHNSADIKVTMAGDPVLSQVARDFMNKDLSRLIPVVTLVVMICLLLSFKKLEGMMLPLITVLVSTVWTVGLMSFTGAHFTVVSSCLPVVLIAVGSAYGIHVLNHYYKKIDDFDGEINKETHYHILKESMSEIKGPVILAGITTIAGFISTITSPIIPLKTFAMFSAIGVFLALLLSLILIPCLLEVKSLKKTNKIHNKIKNNETKDSINLNEWKENAIAHFYKYLSKKRGRLVFIFLVIIALSLWGLHHLNVESSIINYFPEKSSVRQDAKFIDNNFAGTNMFNFAVTGKDTGSLTNPEILKQMDNLSIYLTNKYPEIGKIVSFSDFIKRMNQVMHAETIETEIADTSEDNFETDSFFDDSTSFDSEDVGSFFDDDSSSSDSFFVEEEPIEENIAVETTDSSNLLPNTLNVSEMLDLMNKVYARAGGHSLSVDQFYSNLKKELNYRGAAYDEIPYDPSKYPAETKEELKNLISQYLLLYSGSLDQFANDPLSPSQARMQVQLTTHETKVVTAIIEDAKEYAAQHFPEGYTLNAYGIAELETALTDMITDSQITSLLLAIGIVFIILTIYFHSPIAGLIGAVPLVLSILINFGIMGLAGINLDMVTSLIGSIAIGIGVDYTIHFMSDYHNQRLKTNDLTEVTLNTLSVSGKAIVVNAVSVGLGFLVLSLSQFIVLRYIGILVAIVMLSSSVTAMTILPAMLNIFKPKFISRPIKGKR